MFKTLLFECRDNKIKIKRISIILCVCVCVCVCVRVCVWNLVNENDSK